MSFIKNVFAVIGFVALLLAGVGYQQFNQFIGTLDPQAGGMYWSVIKRFVENQDMGTTMVRVVRAKPGMTPQDVISSLKSLAESQNLLFVGESPFYKQVEAVTGQPYRFISFLSFCDARVGKQMADYNNVYTAFMPCRIAVVEDPDGQVSLQMMDLDMMIYGGRPLPPELKAGAEKVSRTLKGLLEGAASGEF